MSELCVISVCDEDIVEHMGDEVLKALEEKGLVDAVLHRARRFMWDCLDCTMCDWFGDCISDAVKEHIDLDEIWEED